MVIAARISLLAIPDARFDSWRTLMSYLILKVLLSAVLIVAISETAKRSGELGGLLASLPLISLLAIGWLYAETGSTEKVAQLSINIFWLVLPSLPLFLVLPFLLRRGMGFYPALALSILLVMLGYAVAIFLLRRFSGQDF